MKLELQAPWYNYQKKLNALFESDPDIKVCSLVQDTTEEADYVLNIEVRNHEKFQALDRVLPKMKTFGNISVRNIVYDMENQSGEEYGMSLYQRLFEGNDLVADFKAVMDNLGGKHIYLRFKPEVVQFFDDDLTDYSGNWSGLAQDIAREVFEGNTYGVNFCTADKEDC